MLGQEPGRVDFVRVSVLSLSVGGESVATASIVEDHVDGISDRWNGRDQQDVRNGNH